MQSGINEMRNNSIFRLEEKLSSMIRPVKPDPEFMSTLRTKLSRTPSILVESSKKNIGLAIFGAGLFAGAFVFWIVSLLSKGKEKAD